MSVGKWRTVQITVRVGCEDYRKRPGTDESANWKLSLVGPERRWIMDLAVYRHRQAPYDNDNEARGLRRLKATKSVSRRRANATSVHMVQSGV